MDNASDKSKAPDASEIKEPVAKSETTTVKVKEKVTESATTTPAKNNNKKVVLIILGVVLFLLLCCCCGPFIWSSLFGAQYQSDYYDFLNNLENEINENAENLEYDYDTETNSSDADVIKTFAIGEQAVNGDLGIKVLKIEDPYSYSGELYSVEEGSRLVAVELDLTNEGTTTNSYSPYYFDVKDGDNYEYSYEFLTAKEPNLSGGSLTSGETVRGWITFSVPETATDLVLTNEDPISGGKIEVELN